MPQFMCCYHGGKKPATPEEGAEGMKQWKAWTAGLGEALVNPGMPVGITKVLTAEGVSKNPSPHPLMGFSVLEAENMEAALDLLKDCPHLHMFQGTLELSQMMQMPE